MPAKEDCSRQAKMPEISASSKRDSNAGSRIVTVPIMDAQLGVTDTGAKKDLSKLVDYEVTIKGKKIPLKLPQYFLEAGKNVGVNLHPNATGHAYMAAQVLNALDFEINATVHVKNDAWKYFGDADPDFSDYYDIDDLSSLYDAIVLRVYRAEGEAVGQYPVYAEVLQSNGYKSVEVLPGLFEIKERGVTITVKPEWTTIKYGEAIPQFTAEVTDANGNIIEGLNVEIKDVPTVNTVVGTYTITAALDDSNYIVETVNNATLTIEPKHVTITVTPSSAEITVGDDLPEFQAIVKDETGNEITGLNVVISGMPADSNTVGTYTITATLNDSNYIVEMVNDATLDVKFDFSDASITTGRWTMSLNSVIFLNYYPTLTDFPQDFNFEEFGGVVVWTGSSAPTSKEQLQVGAENTTVIEGMSKNDKGEWYVRTHEIYAAHLGDMVYIRPYVKVAEGQYIYMNKAVLYSPARYCYDMLNNLNEREDSRYVCAALLEYGAAAQTYFDYKADELVTTIPDQWPNIDLSIYNLTFSDGYLDPTDITDHIRALARTLTGTKVGVTYNKSTLDLQGAIRMSVGYNIDESIINWDDVKKAEVLFWTEDACANIDSLAYELHNYTYASELTKATGEETVYLGDFRGKSHHILAKDLSDTLYYSCRIEMNDGTVYRNGLSVYSPEAFISDHLASSTGQVVVLSERIAVYSEMARIRFDVNG